MTQYLVAIQLPADHDLTVADDAAARDHDIDMLNDEMRAAGAIVFVGGLKPARTAVSVRTRNGELVVTDGPYMETKEYIGGFWVLEAADMDTAVAWGRKAAIACRAPVEVRPFG